MCITAIADPQANQNQLMQLICIMCWGDGDSTAYGESVESTCLLCGIDIVHEEPVVQIETVAYGVLGLQGL